MPERIPHHARALPVERVARLPFELGTGCNHVLDRRVGVVDMKMHCYRRSADGLRAANSVLGELVGQHERRPAKRELRMPDTGGRLRQAKLLTGAERLGVKLDRLARIVNSEVCKQLALGHGRSPRRGGARLRALCRRRVAHAPVVVTTTGAPRVRIIVCSYCAERLPGSARRVQPSSASFTWRLFVDRNGSIVMTAPSSSTRRSRGAR